MQAITAMMELLANFAELRVVWTNMYKKSDIWEPLSLHKPLLMDPVNPFANVADPQVGMWSYVHRLVRVSKYSLHVSLVYSCTYVHA